MQSIIRYLSNAKKLNLALAISWTVLIIIGCSLPGNELPKMGLFDHFDKVVHFVFFAVFYLLWFSFFYQKKNIALGLIFISCVFGFAIEFYQLHFVAGRSFDVWDGVADTLGAIAAWYLLRTKKMNGVA